MTSPLPLLLLSSSHQRCFFVGRRISKFLIRSRHFLLSQTTSHRLLSTMQQLSHHRAISDRKRFALLVIGDEILKGQVADTNTQYLCRELASQGHRVCEVSIIPDSAQLIAERIRLLSPAYDYVITTGGIGPTHDDVTFEAVAEAFNETTSHHPELVAVVRQYFDKTADPSEPIEAYTHKPYMRLCRVPVSAKLNYGFDRATGERTEYPVVSVRNVFVFPGVPTLCQKAYRLVEHQFLQDAGDGTGSSSSKAHDGVERLPISANVHVNQDEISLTPAIDQLVSSFPQVIVGSYPEWHNRYYKTRVYMEAPSREELDSAKQFFINRIDPADVVQYDAEPTEGAANKMDRFLLDAEAQGMRQFRLSFEVVRRALRSYGLEGVAVGFNGGKDCTALLHLVYAAAAAEMPDFAAPSGKNCRGRLRLLYLRSREQFPEAELFIDESVKRYGVQLVAYEGAMMSCLADAKRDLPQLRAIFMGTRRTDPRSAELQHEQLTDVANGWPEFLRVSPLLDWSYSDVWHFLRGLSLPYCSLYDRGYTSLGDMSNTHPNPRLQYKDSRGLLKYRPAYCLESGEDERRGRNQQQQQRSSAATWSGDARPSL